MNMTLPRVALKLGPDESQQAVPTGLCGIISFQNVAHNYTFANLVQI